MEERATKVTTESMYLHAQRIENTFVAKDVMRISDVCKYLSLSRTTLYRYVEQGIIKPLVLPGMLLFRKDSLDQLFKDGVRFREVMSRTLKASQATEGSLPFLHSDELKRRRQKLQRLQLNKLSLMKKLLRSRLKKMQRRLR